MYSKTPELLIYDIKSFDIWTIDIWYQKFCTGPQMMPGPEMIPKLIANDPWTGNDPQTGPQMIPDRLTINIEWKGPQIWTVDLNFIHFIS